MTFKELLEKSKGTYAGLKYSEESLNEIEDLQDVLDLPNKTPREDIHTTLLYSRKYLPDYNPEKINLEVQPKELHIFDTQDGKRALVLKIKSQELLERHNSLMKEHGATYDFDEYIPHITLSYDIGDIEINNKFLEDMPNLLIVQEYKEDLKLDWKPN